MKIPLIRQGEGPAAALERHRAHVDELRTKLDRIHRHSDAEHVPTKHHRITAGGDHRALRGIPAIGRGVTGAIPGTSPHTTRRSHEPT